MKSRCLFVTVFSLSLAINIFASDNKNRDNTYPSELLKTWKLVVFVNETANIHKRPDWQENDRYTITFHENGRISGRTFSNKLFGEYVVDKNTFSFTEIGSTRVTEIYDGPMYMDALRTVRSYSLLNGELKLYYDYGKYMLFVELE